MNIIYYIASFLAVIFFVGSVQFKEKKNILLSQIIASLCFMTSYATKGAWVGVINEFIEQSKNAVFYGYEKKKKNIPFYTLIIFIMILFVVAYLTYEGIGTVVPLIINFLYFISTYMKNPKYIRIVMIICAFLWIYYNIYAGTYILLISNVFEIISAIIALIRFRDKKESIA